MTIIAVFVLYSLGLDPATGKVKTETKTTESTQTNTTESTQTNTTENTQTTSVNPIYITNEDVPLYPTSTTPVEITLYSTTPPAISSTIPAEFTVYSPSTTSTTPSSTTDNTAYDNIPPPSIYANPVAVNYHGVLADSVRSVQSNFN